MRGQEQRMGGDRQALQYAKVYSDTSEHLPKREDKKMRIVFDTNTSMLTVDDVELKLVPDGAGGYYVPNLKGAEEDNTLGGMSVVHLSDSLGALMLAQKACNKCIDYEGGAWEKLIVGTADAVYAELV